MRRRASLLCGLTLRAEDLHWADEATLDLVKYLGRRIHRAPALLLLSHRDDPALLERLRPLLGDLPAAHTSRLSVPLLSERVVERIAADACRRDAARLHSATGGNAFFVAELLRQGGEGDAVPQSVRDAVLTRATMLPAAALQVLHFVAIVPTSRRRARRSRPWPWRWRGRCETPRPMPPVPARSRSPPRCRTVWRWPAPKPPSPTCACSTGISTRRSRAATAPSPSPKPPATRSRQRGPPSLPAVLDSLGARPLADLLRLRLRRAGAHAVPRGALARTRRNAAGLTGR